ncbi:MAG: IS200/IS605 family transposase [Candidatus Diapherotrites archaeon]|nr:IS200/IS605 family transposase [Candidatus Diapherotrites archaeon]
MKTEITLVSYNHCVGESNLHLQFTPKYRRSIFNDKDVLAECEQQFKQIAAELKVQLAGMGIGPDHAHLFVAGWKNYSIAELAQMFKGVSSRHIRQKYPVRLVIRGLYGDQMWSDGYFHRTVGAVTTEKMKKYITESQQKHWKAEKQKQMQTTLLQCAAL